MEPDLTDTIQTWRGMYGNHSRGPWMAEVERDGMRHSARGQTEDEARALAQGTDLAPLVDQDPGYPPTMGVTWDYSLVRFPLAAPSA